MLCCPGCVIQYCDAAQNPEAIPEQTLELPRTDFISSSAKTNLGYEDLFTRSSRGCVQHQNQEGDSGRFSVHVENPRANPGGNEQLQSRWQCIRCIPGSS